MVESPAPNSNILKALNLVGTGRCCVISVICSLQYEKSDTKFNKSKQKDLDKLMKKDAKSSSGIKRAYTSTVRRSGIIDPGDKPKRSDYKGSKPQRATGSSASMKRAARMVSEVNKLPKIIKPLK